MTTTRLLLAAGLLSISSVLGCASDPNKQAEDAHDSQLKADRKQQESNADYRGEGRVAEAKTERKDTDATATGTPAQKDSTVADAKLTEARDTYRAKAAARLEKLDARTNELKQLVDHAGAKASTSSRDSLTTVDTQRAMVGRALDQFPSVSNDDFKQAKANLDSQIDNLEGLVKKSAAEVDKFKK